MTSVRHASFVNHHFDVNCKPPYERNPDFTGCTLSRKLCYSGKAERR